jgi:hypothetical protein
MDRVEEVRPKACLRAAAGCDARSKTDGKLGRRRSAAEPRVSCLTCRGSRALFESLRSVEREAGGEGSPRLGKFDEDDDDGKSPLAGVGARRLGIEVALLSTIALDSLEVLSLRYALSVDGNARICTDGDTGEAGEAGISSG